MFCPELPHQFGHALEFALRLIGIKCFAQVFGGLFGFDLQQHAIQQHELRVGHALNFLVQDGLELFRLQRCGGLAAFHGFTINRGQLLSTGNLTEMFAPAERRKHLRFS